MTFDPCAPDSVPLVARADAFAARLRLRPPFADADDVRQELLADLIRRQHGFDPSRGCPAAFAAVVFRNRASRIAARLLRERRASGGPLLSLDMLIGTEPLVETLPDEADTAIIDVERRIDVGRAVARLAPTDRALCVAVSRWSVDRLVELGFGSRAGLYRRLRELRCMLAVDRRGIRTPLPG